MVKTPHFSDASIMTDHNRTNALNVILRLDRHNIIREVNDDWCRFAEANNGTEKLFSENVIGKPLLCWFSGNMTTV
ncbi:hypothetical protein MAIT1_04951 [Magnetofaba australis IT-1]|uniref:PAS domain-containing protein n=1 Tax=Magnetofaba australis IT-1 TaxID=1434232 RepID=A0A1Y2KAF0_9PROT|nr:hypothetical protein MAIT1_04951 [Magnetofaba australis IT-1]